MHACKVVFDSEIPWTVALQLLFFFFFFSLVTKSYPTLISHDPMDCSLPGSSVHGISQATILERVSISFSIKISGYHWFGPFEYSYIPGISSSHKLQDQERGNLVTSTLNYSRDGILSFFSLNFTITFICISSTNIFAAVQIPCEIALISQTWAGVYIKYYHCSD